MDKHPDLFDDSPGLDGPDYVALVIEWDEIADTIEDEITARTQMPHQAAAPHARHSLGERAKHALHSRAVQAVVAIAALVLTSWGIRRLRAA